MSRAANHSINSGFITMIVISRPPASRLQDVGEKGGKIILIHHSGQISFKSNFLLDLLRKCFSKPEFGCKRHQKFRVVNELKADWTVLMLSCCTTHQHISAQSPQCFCLPLRVFLNMYWGTRGKKKFWKAEEAVGASSCDCFTLHCSR